jgi:hypothetical protein
MRKPRRINVPVTGAISLEDARKNWEFSARLGLPYALGGAPAAVEKLAVVGSSPGVDFDALREWWGGDIWACNGTCQLLWEQGIPSTMITVDPFNYDCDKEIPVIFGAAKTALVASHCNPKVFEFLIGNKADVRIFHVVPWEKEAVNGGPTTATRAPLLALRKGYKEISFFGLEGSYSDKSHAYKHAVGPWHELTIEAGGRRFKSCVELMMQSQNLAALVRAFPDTFKDRSGGLFGAMVGHFDTWEVVDMSEELKASDTQEAA